MACIRVHTGAPDRRGRQERKNGKRSAEAKERKTYTYLQTPEVPNRQLSSIGARSAQN